MSNESEQSSVYDIVGRQFFVTLVDAFYDGVEHDDVLLRLYPEGSDTIGARHRLALFLMQYWGGPHEYMEERGHPKLRMRHFPFTIGDLERDHWLLHMATAIESVVPLIPESDRERIVADLAQYMVNAAEHLKNQ